MAVICHSFERMIKTIALWFELQMSFFLTFFFIKYKKGFDERRSIFSSLHDLGMNHIGSTCCLHSHFWGIWFLIFFMPRAFFLRYKYFCKQSGFWENMNEWMKYMEWVKLIWIFKSGVIRIPFPDNYQRTIPWFKVIQGIKNHAISWISHKCWKKLFFLWLKQFWHNYNLKKIVMKFSDKCIFMSRVIIWTVFFKKPYRKWGQILNFNIEN